MQQKKLKLEDMIERGKKIKDNAVFERDQENFSRYLGRAANHIRQRPQSDKFLKFWGGIWEMEHRTPKTSWMEKVKTVLEKKVRNVREFNIQRINIRTEIMKKKIE